MSAGEAAAVPDGPPAAAEGPGGALFWISAVVGAAVVAYALRELWSVSSPVSRASLARFLIGGGLVHDALWAPLVAVVLVVTAQLLPVRSRLPVRVGLAFTALVLIVSWAQVRGYGVRANNPSLLPRDYGLVVAVLLAAIWAAVAVALVVAQRGGGGDR
ncbi:MAG: hypothetical protein KF906_05275 [Actinobacteria bacterium]|nr:hypothetical protein [Actinomycetota bacterium]